MLNFHAISGSNLRRDNLFLAVLDWWSQAIWVHGVFLVHGSLRLGYRVYGWSWRFGLRLEMGGASSSVCLRLGVGMRGMVGMADMGEWVRLDGRRFAV